MGDTSVPPVLFLHTILSLTLGVSISCTVDFLLVLWENDITIKHMKGEIIMRG